MRKTLLLCVIVLGLGAWGAVQSYGQGSPKGGQAVSITHGPVIEQVTDKEAIIAWTTNVPSSAVVHYGTDPKNLSQIAEQGWGGQQNANRTHTHRVTLKGLHPNTTYYVQVDSGQGLGTGTERESQVVTIHTTAPGALPQH